MFVSAALPAPGLAQTFALVIAGLCRTTASRIAVDRFAGPLLVRIFTRLHRLAARLTSLVTKIQSGKLPPSRPSRSAASPGKRKPRLPESVGWLVRIVPGAAAYTGQVQALLADPQTTALLAAAPQAGRILRPLCRMLAIPLPDNLRRTQPRSAPPTADPPTADPPTEPQPAASTIRQTPAFHTARRIPRQVAVAAGVPPFPE